MRLRAVVVEAIMRGCEVVKAKVVSGIVGFGWYGVRLWSIFGATAMAGLLIVLLFLLKMKVWLPWRPRGLAVRRDREEPLVLLLKHKDEVRSLIPNHCLITFLLTLLKDTKSREC